MLRRRCHKGQSFDEIDCVFLRLGLTSMAAYVGTNGE